MHVLWRIFISRPATDWHGRCERDIFGRGKSWLAPAPAVWCPQCRFLGEKQPALPKFVGLRSGRNFWPAFSTYMFRGGFSSRTDWTPTRDASGPLAPTPPGARWLVEHFFGLSGLQFGLPAPHVEFGLRLECRGCPMPDAASVRPSSFGSDRTPVLSAWSRG